jgi:hypothetical protein
MGLWFTDLTGLAVPWNTILINILGCPDVFGLTAEVHNSPVISPQ